MEDILDKHEKNETPFDLCIYDGVDDDLDICGNMLSMSNASSKRSFMSPPLLLTSQLVVNILALARQFYSFLLILGFRENIMQAVSSQEFIERLTEGSNVILADQQWLKKESLDYNSDDEEMSYEEMSNEGKSDVDVGPVDGNENEIDVSLTDKYY